MNSLGKGMDIRIKDLTGRKFGKLTVVAYTEERKNNNVIWDCLCDCGKRVKGRSGALQNGNLKSCGCLSKLPYGESSFNHLFDKYKRGASSRKYPFTLTKEEFRSLTSNNCVYCGSSPKTKMTTRTFLGNYIYNGVDRKDNSLGYTTDNSVSCCRLCNKAKSNTDYTTFMAWLDNIVKFRSTNGD
jgi:hypothetical protein